jgi:plasmid stabilization system protein ParE
MIRPAIVRSLAKRDIREARSWYRKISPLLAESFLSAVDDAIALARERPIAFQLVHRTFRRILLHRFPYALFYHADEQRIVVVAVLHQARDPQIIQEREGGP